MACGYWGRLQLSGRVLDCRSRGCRFKSLLFSRLNKTHSYSLLFSLGEQGEGLLWQSWLEKHPDSDPGALPPWDCPDSQPAWEQHAQETYLLYWEQFTYWASQGWSAQSDSTDPGLEGESRDPGGVGGGCEVEAEDGRTHAESSRAAGDDAEVLSGQMGPVGAVEVTDLIGQMSLQSEGGSRIGVGEQTADEDWPVCGGGGPSDGGDRKRAASSSKQSTQTRGESLSH